MRFQFVAGFFCAAVALMFMSVANADTAEIQAQGAVNYGWRLKPENRQEAVQKAKVRAVETWVARDSKSLAKYFSEKKSEIAADIDTYVLSATVIEDEDDKKAKTYTVFIRAEINVNELRAYLEGESATGQASANGVQSQIAIVFMVRQQTSVQAFDDKVYKRVDASASSSTRETLRESSNEGEAVGDVSVQTSGGYDRAAGGEVNSSASTTSGGSRTRKADVVQWTVGGADNVSAAMQGILADAGYEVADASYIEGLDIGAIQTEFSSSPNLSAQTKRSTVSSVRAVGIPILAIGTADVGVRDTDPVTGNIRVNVRVTGQVLDVRGGLPKTLASVGPIQMSGQGTDEGSAQTEAVNNASEKAAQAIVDALNAKGFR